MQGTGSLGCPFFLCLGSLWVMLPARRAPPPNPGPGSQAESAAQRLQESQDRIKQLGASSGTELLAGTRGRRQGEKPSRNPLSPRVLQLLARSCWAAHKVLSFVPMTVSISQERFSFMKLLPQSCCSGQQGQIGTAPTTGVCTLHTPGPLHLPAVHIGPFQSKLLEFREQFVLPSVEIPMETCYAIPWLLEVLDSWGHTNSVFQANKMSCTQLYVEGDRGGLRKDLQINLLFVGFKKPVVLILAAVILSFKCHWLHYLVSWLLETGKLHFNCFLIQLNLVQKLACTL